MMQPLESRNLSSQDPLKRFLTRLAWQMPYVFLFYILSAGPMYWRIYQAYHLADGSPLIKVLYFPLVKACEIDFVANWFNWYIGLWIF